MVILKKMVQKHLNVTAGILWGLLGTLGAAGYAVAKPPIYIGTISGLQSGLQQPWDVLVDGTNGTGDILVASYSNNRFLTFDPMNLLEKNSFAVQKPRGIALNAAKKIFVASESAQRVYQYDSNAGDGEIELTVGGVTKLFGAVQDIAITASDKILIADEASQKIYQYDDIHGTNPLELDCIGVQGLTGTALFQDGFKASRGGMLQRVSVYQNINTHDSDIGLTREPFGIMEGDQQYTAISFKQSHYVKILDATGNVVQHIGTEGIGGSAVTQLQSPQGLYFKHGQLVIADTGNDRVQIYFIPELWKEAGEVKLMHLPLGKNQLVLEPNFRLMVQNELSCSGLLYIKPGSRLSMGSLALSEAVVKDEIGKNFTMPIQLENENIIQVFSDNIISGSVTGNGSLIKSGPQRLTLSAGGDKNFGCLTVNEGTVRIENDVIFSVKKLWINAPGVLESTLPVLTMLKDSTLGGTGVLTGNVQNFGITDLGLPGQVLNINGDYSLAPSSEFWVSIRPSAQPNAADVSQLAILNNHTINLNGKLVLKPEAGIYTQGATYNFIALNPIVNGHLTLASEMMGPYKIRLTNQNKSILIEPLQPNDIVLGLSGNDKVVGDYLLNSMIPLAMVGNEVGNFLGTFGALAVAERKMILEAISPEITPVTHIVAQEDAVLANELTTHRLASFRAEETPRTDASRLQPMMHSLRNKSGLSLPQERVYWLNSRDQRMTGWIQGFSKRGTQKARRSFIPFYAQSSGFVTGIDYAFQKNILVGVGFGKANNQMQLATVSGKNHVDAYLGVLYSTWMEGPWYLEGSLAMVRGLYHAMQSVPYWNRLKISQYRGLGLTPHIGFGYMAAWNTVRLEPSASLEYLYQRTRHYTTNGLGHLNLNVAPITTKALRTKIGMDLKKTWQLGRSEFIPSLGLRYIYQNHRSAKITAGFVHVNTTFGIRSAKQVSHHLGSGVGIKWALETGMHLTATVESEFGSGYRGYEYTAKLVVPF